MRVPPVEAWVKTLKSSGSGVGVPGLFGVSSGLSRPQKGPAERGHIKNRQKIDKNHPKRVKTNFDIFDKFRRAKHGQKHQKVPEKNKKSCQFSTHLDVLAWHKFGRGSEDLRCPKWGTVRVKKGCHGFWGLRELGVLLPHFLLSRKFVRFCLAQPNQD